jgi:hypothetical protein
VVILSLILFSAPSTGQQLPENLSRFPQQGTSGQWFPVNRDTEIMEILLSTFLNRGKYTLKKCPAICAFY